MWFEWWSRGSRLQPYPQCWKVISDLMFGFRYRMSGMHSYNPEQIMLSAAVRRSSRDINVMKEKLIFSGEARALCQDRCLPPSSCSVLLLLEHLENKFLSLYFTCDLLVLKKKKWAVWSFGCSASMTVHPSMHLSECLWMFSFLLFLSSILKVNPSSRLPPASFVCDVHHLLFILPPPYLLRQQWLVSLIHASVASLVTRHLSAYFPLLPFICPLMHQTSPTFLPIGDKLMCREAYRHPSLPRQALVLGVKGKSAKTVLDAQLQLFFYLAEQNWWGLEVSYYCLLTFFLYPLAPPRGGKWCRQCWGAVCRQWLRLLHQSGHQPVSETRPACFCCSETDDAQCSHHSCFSQVCLSYCWTGSLTSCIV